METETASVASPAMSGENFHTMPGFAPERVQVSSKTIYEQPLTERIRSFLRLEFLFKQGRYHLVGPSVWDSRSAIASLMEILDIFSRSDLKSEVIKELERHSVKLSRLAENPDVDSTRLQLLLEEMDVLSDRLHAVDGQIGLSLRKNEFLGGIGQRTAIPGGTCDFDVPAYHYWLGRSTEERSRDLANWYAGFDTVSQSIRLILQLTRESKVPQPEFASAGFFQKTLDPTLPCQLVRVALPAGSPFFAVVSGGRHRMSIRFLELPAGEGRAVQTKQDINFELSCCVT